MNYERIIKIAENDMEEAIKTLNIEKRLSFENLLHLATIAKKTNPRFYYKVIKAVTKAKLQSEIADHFVIEG